MLARSRIWAINGDFVSLSAGGVARYAREVTLAMDALLGEGAPAADGLDVTLIAPREPENLKLRNIQLRVLPEFRRPRAGSSASAIWPPWPCAGRSPASMTRILS
jgi:hypothetical protein